MVCQKASQTTFRTLKHENGIAGCATIIVRVIACFQPLQDCQVSWPTFFTIQTPVSRTVVLRCSIFSNILINVFLFIFQAEYFRHLLKPVT